MSSSAGGVVSGDRGCATEEGDQPNPKRTPTGYIFHGRSTNVTTGPIIFIMIVFWCEPSSTSSESSVVVASSRADRSACCFLIYGMAGGLGGPMTIDTETGILSECLPDGVSAKFCKG